MIALIRHADAGERYQDGRDDSRRPLSAKGLGQARALAASLAAIPFTRVLSSPHRRCRETVAPLAAALDLAVDDERALAEGAPREDTVALIRGLAGADAALCSHGDVIGGVLNLLAAEGLVSAGGLRLDKGSAWLLEQRGEAIVGARYLPPP